MQISLSQITQRTSGLSMAAKS